MKDHENKIPNYEKIIDNLKDEVRAKKEKIDNLKKELARIKNNKPMFSYNGDFIKIKGRFKEGKYYLEFNYTNGDAGSTNVILKESKSGPMELEALKHFAEFVALYIKSEEYGFENKKRPGFPFTETDLNNIEKQSKENKDLKHFINNFNKEKEPPEFEM